MSRSVKPPHPGGVSYDLIGGGCTRHYCMWCCGCGVCQMGDREWRDAKKLSPRRQHQQEGGGDG